MWYTEITVFFFSLPLLPTGWSQYVSRLSSPRCPLISSDFVYKIKQKASVIFSFHFVSFSLLLTSKSLVTRQDTGLVFGATSVWLDFGTLEPLVPQGFGVVMLFPRPWGNACIPPCFREGRRAGWCCSPWGSPGPAGWRRGSYPWPWGCGSTHVCSCTAHNFSLGISWICTLFSTIVPAATAVLSSGARMLHLLDHQGKGQSTASWCDSWKVSSVQLDWGRNWASGQKSVQFNEQTSLDVHDLGFFELNLSFYHPHPTLISTTPWEMENVTFLWGQCSGMACFSSTSNESTMTHIFQIILFI